MNADHFLTTGSKHISQGRPCEDYAWSGPIDGERVVGVVSDGCSGALANTDIGARTITFAFVRYVQSVKNSGSDSFRGDFYKTLQKSFAAPRLTDAPDDYLATLVGFVATEQTASVFLMGDGAIATKDSEGIHQLIEIEWYGNAPYYLDYTLRTGFRERFLEKLPDSGFQAVERRTTEFSSGTDGVHILSCNAERLGFEALENGMVFDFKPKDQGLVALAVMTDGIAHVGSISAPSVVAELLSFKNTLGGFVKRRIRKALTEFTKGGHTARDDIAISCVWMGE